MNALSRGCFAFLIVVSFAVTSSAKWNWFPTQTNSFYARVQDGQCSSGVTVFYKDDWYGRGWRVAFDNHKFRNLNLRNPEDAMTAAEILFRKDYCGTENYQPTCPNGVLSPSQQAGKCMC